MKQKWNKWPLWVMHKFPTDTYSCKWNFVTKVFFLLICLHFHIIDHIRKQTFEGKRFLHSFIHFIYFKHAFKEVDRKVAMESVFSMSRDFKAQLCLWTPPLPINSTRSWCTNSGMAPTEITSSILEKVVLTITRLEWLLATHINFDRNTGGKTSKIKLLFEPNFRYSSFKSTTELGFCVLHPCTLAAKVTQLHIMSSGLTPRYCS